MKSINTLSAAFTNRSNADPALAYFLKQTKSVFVPIIGVIAFLLIWSVTARNIDTSLGQFPGPDTVVNQFSALYQEHVREREKAEAFMNGK